MKINSKTLQQIEKIDKMTALVLTLRKMEGNIALLPSHDEQEDTLFSRTLRDAPPNEQRIRGIV